METLKRLVVFSTIGFVLKIQCQPSGLTLFEPLSACFGVESSDTTINVTCTIGHVVALSEITMGAKLTESGCPYYYNSSLGYDTCCTYTSTDCTYQFIGKQYHEQCNGQRGNCKNIRTQAQEIYDSCSSLNGTFGAEERYSHYMFIKYYCIEDDKMVDMCATSNSLTLENTTAYIWNRDFPTSSIQPTDTSCNCSVEIDNCQAGINISTIYRQLTGNGAGICNQTLRVGNDDKSSVLYEWSCDSNTLSITTDTVNMTYILINLENQRNETDGKFWLGFEATTGSNITVSCPPTTQQYCQQTTTSTTTSTTTVTTKTTNVTTSNITTTDATEVSTSTTTSTESTTNNETITTGQTSNGETDNNLLMVVIVLSVIVALLLIVIIVLLCCLYRRCCMKTDNDVEKVAVKNKQPLPPPDLTQNMRPDLKQSAYSPTPEHVVPVNAVDVGCQVQIDQVYTKECLVEHVIIQKTDNATTNNLETVIKHAEIGCQVNLFPPEIQADNSKTEKGTNRLPQIQLIDKETLTLSISQSDRQCQTDVLQKKSQKVQANIVISTPVKIASCQTDTVLKDDVKQEESKPVTIVPNGTIPTSPRDERSAIPMKSEGVIPANHRIKKKIRKKKRIIESDEEPDLRISNISPASLEAVTPEIRHESPANQTFLYKLETEMEEDMSDDRDTEVPGKYDKDVRTIHVRPESPPSDDLSAEVNHVLKIRKNITNSFFGKERYEEKLIRAISKQSKKVRKKKKVNKTYSEC